MTKPGLPELPSQAARWARVYRIIRAHGALEPVGQRREKVEKAARDGDPLAAYVAAVARLLDVDLSRD